MSYENFTCWSTTPASLDPELSVVIPAYNEAERIVPTIMSIAATLSDITTNFEIILSDDGSTDDTPHLVRNLGLRNLIVLDPGVNRGRGAAVREGMRAANGRRLLFSDVDMSTPMREVVELNRCLDEGADIAIGSRTTDGAVEQSKSTLRRVFSRGRRRITRAGLGLDISDAQCAFKLFNREAAHAVSNAGRVDGLGFDAEILFLAARFGFEVREVPVERFDAPGSEVRPGRDSLRFLRDVIAIRAAALVGRYPQRAADVAEQRMTVAIVTAVPPSNATLTEYGHHLVLQLAAKPEIEEVMVFAEDSAGLPGDTDGVSYRAAWTFGSVMTPWRILRQIRTDRPDVVFFNMHFTSFGSGKVSAALGLMTPALVRLTRAKSVVLLHNIVDTVDLDQAGYGSHPVINRALTAIGRMLTKFVLLADTVVTTMPQYVEVLRDKYGADNVYLTPHGSFDHPSEPVAENTDGPFRLMTFGKFGTYKRVDELVEAHRILLERGHDIECIIAGTDSPNAEGYLADVAARNTDVEHLKFTGYVAEADVPGLFTNASAVVFPYTSTTGSSGPLHQTGTYARAAIAPRVGDFIDLIEKEGFDAEVFEPGDVLGLVAAIEALIADPLRRQAMGRQNFAAACSLPLAHVTDWHVAHFEALVAA